MRCCAHRVRESGLGELGGCTLSIHYNGLRSSMGSYTLTLQKSTFLHFKYPSFSEETLYNAAATVVQSFSLCPLQNIHQLKKGTLAKKNE